MEKFITDLITNNFYLIILSLFNNALTAIIKMPIKNLLCKKVENSKIYTKYLTFLPIIIGFCITIVHFLLNKMDLELNTSFVEFWVKNSSLSLAFYAFEEKFAPNKKKVLEENEIVENKKLLKEIEQIFLSDNDSKNNASFEKKTFILRGKKDE